MIKSGSGYKTFNTSGMCFPRKHYMVDPLTRLQEVEVLIGEELYFTIHAPRQTGKTTYLYTLAETLHREGNYCAVVASCERAGLEGLALEKANELLIDSIFRASTKQCPEEFRPENPMDRRYVDLHHYLEIWAERSAKPIVLFLDEIDALLDEALVSVLRQLRDGYQNRPGHFPSSIVLVGLRDVRDYKAKIRKELRSYVSASPFNIKSDSLFLNNFSRDEVFELLEQHGNETGQVFPEPVMEEIFNLTGGQPWLTNALARQIVFQILKYDFSQAITMELLNQARRQLILRRDTHLDSLVEKLKEDRVKRIVQAVINGESLSFDILEDDIVYARDIGIIQHSDPLKFANPIYAEIIPRIMASPIQSSIPENIRQPWFLTPEGLLDMDKLLREFQQFYQRNSEAWLHRFEYKESAQHLLLMAFIQRVVNSGGEIIRGMAVGNGRIDMLVKFKGQEFALELKIKRSRQTLDDGLDQLSQYLDTLGISNGYLVVFDPSPREWKEKLSFDTVEHQDKKIKIVGL